MSAPKLTLPEGIISPQDLHMMILDVRTYSKWCAKAAIKKQLKAGEAADPPAVNPTTLELLKDWTAKQPMTQKSLEELIENLEYCKATAPIITITLAAPAGNVLRRQLVAWCRQNMSPNALVSFAFNATLLGGMVVQCGSHIYDWSFRRQILANRAKFGEILRRV